MLQKYHAGRVARVAGGIAGTVLGVCFLVWTVLFGLYTGGLGGLLFGFVWPATLFAAGLGYVYGWRRARTDANLERHFELAGRTFSLEIRSVAWPLTALAVLLPVSAMTAFVMIGPWQLLLLSASIFPWQLGLIYYSWRMARGVPVTLGYVVRVALVLAVLGVMGLGAAQGMNEILLLATSALFGALWTASRALIRFERRRLAAATEVREQPERLRAIVLDEDRDDAARIMAMYTLARTGSRQHIFPVIDDALNSNHAVSAAALDLARDLRHRPPVSRVARNFYHGARRSVGVACELAASSRDPELEQPLLVVLGEAIRNGETELALLAIRALASCGTIASVDPLRRVRRNAVISQSIWDAADEAVSAIRAREMPSAGGGQLSLAEENSAAGAVSFPKAEAGALSPAISTSTGAS